MDRYVSLPPLPARNNRLNDLAYDLWWSWDPRARDVFRTLDYPLWRFTDHNPVLLLHLLEVERLDYAASDAHFLGLYDEAIAALDRVRTGAGTWWVESHYSSAPIAAVNGVPHIDPPSARVAGAFDGGNGWLLDPRRRDEGAYARFLYGLLEERLVPDFYARDRATVGVAWAGIMRRTLMAALPHFSARRAVKAWAAGPPLVGSTG